MMNYVDFKTPASVAEARALMKELGPQASPVAGSTLHVFLRDESPKVAVDISRLGLNSIETVADGFRIGATSTVSDLQDFHAPGWVLDRVAREFVTQPIRNVATLGGSIIRVFPWSDLPIPLLALDAVMEIEGDDIRRIEAGDFFKSQPFHHLQSGDLLTAIHVPALAAEQGFGYHKERRTSTDFSRCSVAVWMKLADGQVEDVRIAVGAAVPMPLRMKAMEQALQGKKPSQKNFENAVQAGLDEGHWKGLHGISNEYARHLASVIIVDMLHAAADEAKGDAV